MTATDIAFRVLPPAVPALTAIAAAVRGPGALRSKILRDAEIVAKLPESQARETMLELLHVETTRLKAYQTGTARYWTKLTSFVLATAGFGYLTAWLVTRPHWWSWFAIATGYVGLNFLIAVFQSARRVPKDATATRRS